VRADRLVAILLMLQQRGQVTAVEVADELEISERTARRDFEALGAAGLPVYAQQGRNGGWRLAGGGRTDLSGLTAAEVRALFLVASPTSTTPDVKNALRKLVRALPEEFRPAAEAVASSVVVDPNSWGSTQQRRPLPHALDAVQSAVIEGHQVRIGYTDRQRAATDRIVEPLGLAAKGHTWYLIAQTEAGMRTFRVDRIMSVRRTGNAVARPKDFNLAETWRQVAEEIDERRTPLLATAIAQPSVIGLLRNMLGTRLKIGPSADAGVQIEIRGHSAESLAAEIAGLADRLEITGPADVRRALHRIGETLIRQHRGGRGIRVAKRSSAARVKPARQ
jgi:predicted DNA-binding transcriptional regulator YafY